MRLPKVFLDTNIIIDFLAKREPYYMASARILTLADYQRIKVYTSANALVNAFYVLRKYESYEKLIEKIKKFKIICKISVLNEEVVNKALYSDFQDFEDAIQYQSAIAQRCDFIITRNEKDFSKSEIKVMNAENFIEKFVNSQGKL